MPRFLGPFEHLLLLALARLGDDAYTASIRTFLEETTGRDVSPGAIYTALSRLERRGLVSSRFGDPTPERGGKRKKFFRLEPHGAAAVRDAQQQLSRLGRSLAPRLRSLS
jgi:DNA-binding PadR family transcriptional regulator